MVNWKRTVLAVLLALCMSLLLTACGTEPQQENPNAPVDATNELPDDAGMDTDAYFDYFYEMFQEGENAVLEKTAEHLKFFEVAHKGGKLIFTLTNPRIISSTQELPVQEKFIDGTMAVDEVEGMPYTPDRGGQYKYPDFVYPDGHFVAGAHYLLIDVLVESDQAENYTTADVSPQGYTLGEYNDPYIFPMPGLFLGNRFYYEAEDWKEPSAVDGEWILQNPDTCTFVINADYFSRLRELSDDPHLATDYRLEPGETLSFTLGYPVTEKAHGGLFDMEAMSLYNVKGTTGRLCGLTINDDGTLQFS